MKLTIVINGPPLPWKAPLKGSHGFYSSRHHINKIIEDEIRSQYDGEILKMPLKCDLYFYLSVPKSYSNKKRLLCLSGAIKPTSHGDRTNCAKYYEDRLQGIVIENDKQIVDGRVCKRYSEEAHTVIYLTDENL